MTSEELKPYMPAIAPGETRIRVARASLENPYGREPAIVWHREEQILGADGNYRYVPIPPLYTSVNAELLASDIELIDPDTGTSLGQSMKGVAIVAALTSLFIKEDIRQAQQVIATVAMLPPTATGAP